MLEAKPGYVVYIGEAGDPGLRDRPNRPAWTEWFTLGTVVVAAHREAEVIGWVEETRHAAKFRQKPDFHYPNLSLANKRRVCRILALNEVRLFSLSSLKAHLRSRRSPILGMMGSDNYYNWCLRLLLERVTGWCVCHTAKSPGTSGTLKTVFSEKGGHRYQDLVD